MRQRATMAVSAAKILTAGLVGGVLGLGAAQAATTASTIPKRPEELHYAPLKFDVPPADQYRHELANGVVVYVVEDHALPLVELDVTARVGGFLDPQPESGLAEVTGTMLRQGGTESMSAEDFDEKADFLAADISSGSGDTSGTASLNVLSSGLDQGLDLLFDMLEHPRFQQNRLDVEKGNLLESMKQRNDEPGSIMEREWQWLLYGPDHFTSQLMTKGTLDAISRDDLLGFHAKYWQPKGMVVAVSGDVDTQQILAALEQRFAAWPTDHAADVPWPPPAPQYTPQPGLYQVEKDIPQSRVQIGHLGLQWQDWSNPGDYAVMVMNDILGGGGFTSHIMSRIRSDEGLAYSAGSAYGIGTFWPGTFRVYYQSKNATVGYAAAIGLEELKKMQQQPPTAAELTTAKNSFVETFPRRFETADKVAGTFASDEFIGRPHDYWYHYRDHIQAVSADDVLKAAQDYLHPDKLVALVVGPWEQITGPESDQRGHLEQVFPGPVHHLPLRDPLTLEPKPGTTEAVAPAAPGALPH